MAVKMATAMGNNVTVISHSSSKRESALAAGAVDFVNSCNSEEFSQYQGKFDLILDTVSGRHPVREYMALLKTQATMCLVGVPPSAFELMPMDIIFGRKKLGGSMIGGIKETEEMLQFCAEHKIIPDVACIPVKDVNHALYKLGEGISDAPRYVIDISTLKSEDDVVEDEPLIDITKWKVNPMAQIEPETANLHKSSMAKAKSKGSAKTAKAKKKMAEAAQTMHLG